MGLQRLTIPIVAPRDPSYVAVPEPASCPKCHGAGILVEGWSTDGRSHNAMTRLCPECAIPALLATMPPFSFANFRARTPLREAVARARACAEGKQPWCVLVGPPGTGKTHLAWAIARHWIERGLQVQFWQTSELLGHLRQGIDADVSGDGLEERTLAVASAGGLVLDDLGHYKRTSWTDDRVATVINHRYRNRLPLVATANLPEWAELQREMPWVYSRLTDRAYSGGAVLIGPRTRDYRQTRGLTKILQG